MSAIDALNPKGKTPLGDAVREAAEILKYTEERATVLLVSDGKETCHADPCAVAAELEANGIDFTAHVVGFDLTDEEKTQLQCIADNTGGKFLSAGNASELHEAMEMTVALVADPDPEPVVDDPTGIMLAAVLAMGGEPVRAHFEIRKGQKADDNGKGPGIANLTGESVVAELPAGSYHVVVRYGETEIAEDIDVQDGKLNEETLVLGTGTLHLSAVLTEAGEPIGAKLRVLESVPDSDGKHDMIAGKSSKPEEAVGFGLPAGDYLVEAVYGDAEITGNVQIKAGEITEKVMVMNAGFLEAWGTRAEGGEPMHAKISVHRAEIVDDILRSHVTGGYSKDYKNARFALAAGRYRITAKDGNGGEAEVEVDMEPGKTLEVPIIVP